MNDHIYKGRSKKDVLKLKKDQMEGIIIVARNCNYITNVEMLSLSNFLKLKKVKRNSLFALLN